MNIKTGQTIYELVASLDPTTNEPVSGVSFNSVFFIDGTPTNTISLSIGYANQSAATYYTTWSAATYGHHQFYLKNQTTNIVYMSEIYNVLPDNQVDPSPTIYVGL